MDLVNRLKHYMAQSQVTISQFADRCGIPRPTMSQLMNGRNKRISDEVITKIHNAFPNLSVLWLMFGEGEMTSFPNNEISEPQKSLETASDLFHDTESQANGPKTSQAGPFTESTSTGNPLEDMLFESAKTEERPVPYDCPYEEATSRENISFETHSQPSFSPTSSAAPAVPSAAPLGRQSSHRQQPSGATNPSNDITRTLGLSQTPTQQCQGPQQHQPTQIENTEVKHISISPDAHKKITNIVVFYSDNSFQSFLPDA